MSPTAKASPIRGTQLFTADPPGFVWSGRVRIAPFVWIDVRDMFISGEGSMRVLLDDTVALADARGAPTDQGAALRLLAEMVWYPTSLFDPRYVTWTAIDADHARARLRVCGCDVSGVFEFGVEGLPLGMSAKRFMDKGTLRPWGGVYRDWRTYSRTPIGSSSRWSTKERPARELPIRRPTSATRSWRSRGERHRALSPRPPESHGAPSARRRCICATREPRPARSRRSASGIRSASWRPGAELKP